jgi:hypothetical protein
MCHTPIVIRATQALFQRFDKEIYPQNQGWVCPIDGIGVSACPMAVFGDFYESP